MEEPLLDLDPGGFTVVDFTLIDPPIAELCLLHHHYSAAAASEKEDVQETEWRIKK